jgi:hypothetical protein
MKRQDMRTRGKRSWRQWVAAAGGMLVALGAAPSPALGASEALRPPRRRARRTKGKER